MSFDFWLSSGLNKKRLRLYVSSPSIKIGTRLKTSTSWGYQLSVPVGFQVQVLK